MDTIDLATLEDLPQLVDLLDILFRQECDFQPNPSKQDKGLRLLLSSPSTGRVFVFRQEAQVVGMLSVLFTVSTVAGGRVCWLEDMVVHPQQRSVGIGTRLLRHAIQFAEMEGLLRITLLTDRCNEAAQRFYQRQGFQASNMVTLRRQLA